MFNKTPKHEVLPKLNRDMKSELILLTTEIWRDRVEVQVFTTFQPSQVTSSTTNGSPNNTQGLVAKQRE